MTQYLRLKCDWANWHGFSPYGKKLRRIIQVKVCRNSLNRACPQWRRKLTLKLVVILSELRPREEKLQWIYYVTTDRQQQAVSMMWFPSQFDHTDQSEHWSLSWKQPSWQFFFEPPWMRGWGAKLLANAHKLSKQVAFINSIGASHRHRH